jgi:hypothetical protein
VLCLRGALRVVHLHLARLREEELGVAIGDVLDEVRVSWKIRWVGKWDVLDDNEREGLLASWDHKHAAGRKDHRCFVNLEIYGA